MRVSYSSNSGNICNAPVILWTSLAKLIRAPFKFKYKEKRRAYILDVNGETFEET